MQLSRRIGTPNAAERLPRFLPGRSASSIYLDEPIPASTMLGPAVAVKCQPRRLLALPSSLTSWTSVKFIFNAADRSRGA